MNTSGVKGAEIFEATLYVEHRWSASCYNTPAVVYGTKDIDSWSSSGLNWNKQPGRRTGVLSTVQGQELNCGKSNEKPSPPRFDFKLGV